MRHCALKLVSAALLIVAISCYGFAQGAGASSTLTGTVVDQSGGVIPGADVLVKNDATGAEFKAVTAENGTFSIPALSPGVYTATVTVPNFKKAEVKNITLVAGTPATIRVALVVGGSTETVIVEAGAQIVQSQSATVATTLAVNQITQLPLATRNVMDFLVMLPGVNTTGGARNSTVEGMPIQALSITLDGVNTQDNYLKNDFFTYISPRLDAIQEVTVSTSTPGAESSGTGAVQIRFVTRSGNNEYHGSLYEYHRNPALNSNYWFNNRNLAAVYQGDPGRGVACTPEQLANEWDKCKAPRDRVLFNQPGGRVGGPITIPKLFDGRDKAFFFFNYEEFRLPAQRTRTRTIYNPLVEQGSYVYLYQGVTPYEVRSVKLLGADGIAAKNGQTATWDPTVQKLLADIRNSTGCPSCNIQEYPIVSNPLYQNLLFKNKSLGIRKFPTARFDFNLTNSHRLEASWNYSYYGFGVDMLNNLDPIFPDFPVYGTQGGNRFASAVALRSTLTPRIVNEARVGFTGGTTLWSPNVDESAFTGSVANYGTHVFGLSGISTAYATNSGERRNAPVTTVEDTLTWTRGTHSFSFGGSWENVGGWQWVKTILPSVSFGLPSAYDPAYVMFDATNGKVNFPGATSGQITTASNIYAMMTARVTSISASAILNETTNQYEYNGPRVRRSHQREMGIFAQDSWRVKPNLTLNYGLRWELQRPWTPLNNGFAWASPAEVWGPSGVNSLFKPGATGGVPSVVNLFNPGDPAYKPDYKTVSPTFGFAWTPGAREGILGRILGGGAQTVLRGGFSVAYNRWSISTYVTPFGGNPGGTITASRSQNLGNLIVGNMSYPVLYRDKSLIGPPEFAKEPQYPLTPAITNSIYAFSQDFRTPYTMSWSFGMQRELSKDTVLEIRYAGNKSLQGLTNYDLNELNIVENGWLDEFWLAQKNLYANITAGRGTNFRYYGAGTGTSPLPITIAYLGGKLDPNDPASYTTAKLGSSQGGFFTNATYTNNLNQYSPAAASLADTLQNDATRRANALAAGLPANFFYVNPYVNSAVIYQNGGWSKYDSMVVELRRRMAKGLLVQASYVFAKGFGSSMLSFRRPRVTGLGGTLPHAFKLNWVYELPVGSGRALLNSTHGVLDRVIGGWEIQGTGRIQAGNLLDFDGAYLVGMTDQELRDAVGLRFDDAGKKIYYYPQDIIDQSYKASSYNVSNYSASNPMGFTYGEPSGRYIAPANSRGCYEIVSGDCAPMHHYFRGPMFTRFDISLVKRIRFTESKNFELRGELLNAFNNINFYGVDSIGGLSSGQVSSAYTDSNQQQDPGGRLIQVVLRFNF